MEKSKPQGAKVAKTLARRSAPVHLQEEQRKQQVRRLDRHWLFVSYSSSRHDYRIHNHEGQNVGVIEPKKLRADNPLWAVLRLASSNWRNPVSCKVRHLRPYLFFTPLNES